MSIVNPNMLCVQWLFGWMTCDVNYVSNHSMKKFTYIICTIPFDSTWLDVWCAYLIIVKIVITKKQNDLCKQRRKYSNLEKNIMCFCCCYQSYHHSLSLCVCPEEKQWMSSLISEMYYVLHCTNFCVDDNFDGFALCKFTYKYLWSNKPINIFTVIISMIITQSEIVAHV